MSANEKYSLTGSDIVSIANDGMLRIAQDDELTIVYANEKYFDITGYKPDSFGMKLGNYILPEDAVFIKNALKGTNKDEQCYITFRITDSEDEIRWLSANGYMSDVEYEGMHTFVCSVTDITQIKNYRSEMETAYNNIPCGVVHFYIEDGKIKILKGNKYYYTMPGNESFSFGGEYELNVYRDDLSVVVQSVQSQTREKSTAAIDYRAVTNDGRVYWVNMTVSVIGQHKGHSVYLAILFDITQKRNAVIELEKERERYAAMHNVNDIVFEYDYSSDECIFYILDKKSLIKGNLTTVVTDFYRKVKDGNVVRAEDIDVITNAWINRDFSNLILKLKVQGEDRYNWYHVRGDVIFDAGGVPVKIVGNMQDIDEIKRRETEIEGRGKIDALSRVYTRDSAINEIDEYLGKKDESEKAYFCILDLDNFKNINDTYGIKYGDALITMAASSIKDAIGRDDIVGRFGGDEFMILLKNSSHSDVARIVDTVLRSILKLRVDINDTEGISCSIGIVCSDVVDEPSYNKLFVYADKALYKAKKVGKNQFIFYDKDDAVMQSGSRLRLAQSTTKSVVSQSPDYDIMSVAFEILDRSDNLQNAVRMFLKHVGANMRLEKIKIFQVNQVTNEVIIAYAWNRDVNIPEKSGNRGFYIPEDIREYVNLFNQSTLVQFQPSVIKRFSQKMQDQLNRLNDRTVFYGAVIDDGDDFSMIMYQTDDLERVWTAAELNMLQEITKVLSMYLNRDKKIEEAENRMMKLLNYDELTGTFTLKRFRELAQRCIEENVGEYMIIYLDFVHFKYINDLYGYEVGDEILCDFANFVARYKANDNSEMARISGDEFVAVAPSGEREESVRQLKEVFEAYCRIKNEKYPLANLMIRAGIYFLDGNDNAILAIDRANLARKSLAHLTCTEIAVFDENIYNQLMLEAEMSRSMRSALNDGEFVAFLQPKVDIRSLEVVGAEALVRWFRKDGTVMPPYIFIPYFERNGFVTEIDFCIFKQVVHFIAQRQERGEKIVPISVNLSRVNARVHNLAERIIEYVEKYKVSPKYIEFEITETVFDEMESTFVENINKLRDYGFKIDIDDFGSGYSSLSMLSEMPADIIKLDRSLIINSLKSEKKAKVIKHTVYMIAAINCDIICEGVETKEEVEFLKTIGCNKVQGYYFAKPMPIKEFCGMVDKKMDK